MGILVYIGKYKGGESTDIGLPRSGLASLEPKALGLWYSIEDVQPRPPY